jgi:hypothetical protein
MSAAPAATAEDMAGGTRHGNRARMLNHPKSPLPVRFVAQVFDGAAKPVGGDSAATIQLNVPEQPAEVGPPQDSPAGAQGKRRRGA